MFIKHLLMNRRECVIPDIEASLREDVYYVGEDVDIIIALPEDSTGTVSTTVNSQEYTGTVYNGSATISISGLSADEYNLVITYSGDNIRYKSTDIEIHFSVFKKTPTVSATGKDTTEGKTEIITVTVRPRDATGRCFAILENKKSGVVDETEYYADVINTTAKISISNLSAGKYIAYVRYSGDDTYLPLSIDPFEFSIDSPNSSMSLYILSLHRKDVVNMASKYYLASNEGHRVEVSESYFDSVQQYYDESNISATGDSYGNEEIVLYVDEVDMPLMIKYYFESKSTGNRVEVSESEYRLVSDSYKDNFKQKSHIVFQDNCYDCENTLYVDEVDMLFKINGNVLQYLKSYMKLNQKGLIGLNRERTDV